MYNSRPFLQISNDRILSLRSKLPLIIHTSNDYIFVGFSLQSKETSLTSSFSQISIYDYSFNEIGHTILLGLCSNIILIDSKLIVTCNNSIKTFFLKYEDFKLDFIELSSVDYSNNYIKTLCSNIILKKSLECIDSVDYYLKYFSISNSSCMPSSNDLEQVILPFISIGLDTHLAAIVCNTNNIIIPSFDDVPLMSPSYIVVINNKIFVSDVGLNLLFYFELVGCDSSFEWKYKYIKTPSKIAKIVTLF